MLFKIVWFIEERLVVLGGLMLLGVVEILLFVGLAVISLGAFKVVVDVFGAFVLLVLFVEFNVVSWGKVLVTFIFALFVVGVFMVEVLRGVDGLVIFDTGALVPFTVELLVVKLVVFGEVDGLMLVMLVFVELVLLLVFRGKLIPTFKGLLPNKRLLLLAMSSQTLVFKFKLLPL
jgi:hypothetical protein